MTRFDKRPNAKEAFVDRVSSIAKSWPNRVLFDRSSQAPVTTSRRDEPLRYHLLSAACLFPL